MKSQWQVISAMTSFGVSGIDSFRRGRAPQMRVSGGVYDSAGGLRNLPSPCVAQA
jgi:hypothetical protein